LVKILKYLNGHYLPQIEPIISTCTSLQLKNSIFIVNLIILIGLELVYWPIFHVIVFMMKCLYDILLFSCILPLLHTNLCIVTNYTIISAFSLITLKFVHFSLITHKFEHFSLITHNSCIFHLLRTNLCFFHYPLVLR